MPKAKSSGRARRKNTSNRGKTRTNPPRRSKRNSQLFLQQTPPRNDFESDDKSSSSETSPFKGWNEEDNAKELKFFDDVSDSEDKESLFDKLLDSPLRNRFLTKNIKTYSNKKKMKQDSHLLEFQDNKNRDHIIQWLNDNRNVFDRLTQTQPDHVVERDSEIPFSLDMPSVSQLNNSDKRIKSPVKSIRKTRRSPYRLRARSLDIHITKNGLSGRNKRHSLAGDTPSMENYHIEEIHTNEEASIPAENNAKLLVNLMEDEYLSILEKEILQSCKKDTDKNNQSVSGWERIKDITKTINGSKKNPKQLNITLQGSQSKKSDISPNKCYDLNQMENYFIEKMETMMRVKDFEGSIFCSQAKTDVEACSGHFIDNILKVGNSFIDVLKKVINNSTGSNLTDLKAMAFEIKKIFNQLQLDEKEIGEVALQTDFEEKYDKQIQTSLQTANAEIQTEKFTCQNCANNNTVIKNKIPLCNKIVQTKIETNYKIVQTRIEKNDKIVQTKIDKESVEIQTENNLQSANLIEKNAPLLLPYTSGSTTPSDVFLLNEMERLISVNENTRNNFSEGVNKKISQSASYGLSNTLDDIQFDTEEVLRREMDQVKETKAVEDIPRTAVSVLVCSIFSKNKPGCSKGVKRVLDSPTSDDSERSQIKRPCTKFIKDNLSVAFDSCADDANRSMEKKDVIALSDDSDDVSYDQYLDEVMQKYDKNLSVKSSSMSIPIINKTQRDIEDLEEKIRNATKPNRRFEILSEDRESFDSDVIFIEAEKNLSEFEKDLEYFQPHCSVMDTERTPKKSRKKLFKSQDNKFSESLFSNTLNGAVVEVKNADVAGHVSDVEADREVRDIMSSNKGHKINILQNVIVKTAKQIENVDNEEGDDDFILSGIDVVESTPQKKYSSMEEQGYDSALDITLPPPLEFQDGVDNETENKLESTKASDPAVTVKKPSPLRRPLATINKITSTQLSHTQASENISLSPIPPVKGRTPGPIELAQRAKFSPLTIVKTSQSQKNLLNISVGTSKQKNIVKYVRPSRESSPEDTPSVSSPSNLKPCVSCSRIGRDQVMAISTMANRKLASYSAMFSRKVTHLIVSVKAGNRIKDHTIKSMSAIAAGIWVLSFGWVQECLARNAIVPEEPYEVLNVNGVPGPRKSRLMRLTNPLLKGFKIYLLAPFLTATVQDLQNIVKMLGGKVVSAPEELLDKNNDICLIITEGKTMQDCDSEKFETWLDVLRVVTVDLEWLSRSVGEYQLQSLLPFILCSDDFIDSLGYPPELLKNVPVSFLQSTSSTQVK